MSNLQVWRWGGCRKKEGSQEASSTPLPWLFSSFKTITENSWELFTKVWKRKKKHPHSDLKWVDLVWEILQSSVKEHAVLSKGTGPSPSEVAYYYLMVLCLVTVRSIVVGLRWAESVNWIQTPPPPPDLPYDLLTVPLGYTFIKNFLLIQPEFVTTNSH